MDVQTKYNSFSASSCSKLTSVTLPGDVDECIGSLWPNACELFTITFTEVVASTWDFYMNT